MKARDLTARPDRPTQVGRAAFDPWLWFIVLAGLLIRLPAIAHVYYPHDIAFWKSWLTYSTSFGLQNVYGLDLPGQTYPPVLLYLLFGLGSIYRGIWPQAQDTPILTAFVKIPAIAGDLAAAILLAVYARRHKRPGSLGPRAAAAILAFHPALFWLSSLWGQVDVLHGGLAAGAWAAAIAGSAGWAGALVALGILTKPQGLIVAPAIAVLLAARAGRRGLVRATLFGAAVTVVVTLPFVLAGFRVGDRQDLCGSRQRLSVPHAEGVQSLVVRRGREPDRGGCPRPPRRHQVAGAHHLSRDRPRALPGRDGVDPTAMLASRAKRRRDRCLARLAPAHPAMAGVLSSSDADP